MKFKKINEVLDPQLKLHQQSSDDPENKSKEYCLKLQQQISHFFVFIVSL